MLYSPIIEVLASTLSNSDHIYVFLFVKPTLFPPLQGYIIPMDFIWLKHLIPDVLRNNKEFLFGNIRELYEFHNRYIMIQIIRENGK